MKITNITNEQQWNDFVKKNHGSFLQSFQWGAFQYSYGRNVKYLAVMDQDKIVAGTLLIKHALPASRFYYFSPYGPIKYHEILLDYIREQARKEKAIFWRYETKAPELSGLEVKAIHPKKSLVLDLADKSEEQLLKDMKSKTRYNIRLALKKGVNIKTSTDIQNLQSFYDLVINTSKRQKISAHPLSYYQTMFHSLADSGFIKIYLAEYQNKILAANLIVFFHDTVTYLHGGTSHQYREVMAPHLLQWQAISDAQQAGYKYYDFFGIAETNNPSHSWAGITRFKKGFGGQVKEYSGTYELPFNNIWYNGYKMAKKLKSK